MQGKTGENVNDGSRADDGECKKSKETVTEQSREYWEGPKSATANEMVQPIQEKCRFKFGHTAFLLHFL